jgi:predicted transposase YdaD
VSENNNPYDTLFRAAFAEPQAAKDLTLFLLPQSRERGFAAAQVTVEPESLVDEQARTHRTDLLLQFSRPRRGGATRAASAYVYVLYEHKSYSYRWVTVQLLRYMATIWQRLTGETDKHGDGLLPEILPVVIYHGGEPWAAPLQFAELVEGGREAAHVPHYEPVFVDLTGIEDHRITGPLRLMLGLIALKYARKKMTQADGDLLTELLHRGSADPATRHLVQVVEQVYVTVKPESEVKALVAAATRLA